jgi:Fe-S-cluster containining protein
MPGDLPAPCDCEKCKHECEKVPGWFTPAEATRAIGAGYANRMSLVAEKSPDIAFALAPSIVGWEGKSTAFAFGRCSFLTKEGRCEIHDSGFKPIECRFGYGCRRSAPDYPEPEAMRALWRTVEGDTAIRLWQSKVGPEGRTLNVLLGGA